jgi:hypothetical protein
MSNWVKEVRNQQTRRSTRNPNCRDQKVCYASRKIALAAASQAANAGTRSLGGLEPYKCMDCKEWHLTSHPIRKPWLLSEYRGHHLDKSEGLWTCQALAGQCFISLSDIRKALDAVSTDEEATDGLN